jgi:parvulin-like peptidyl-prolyl isomerase
LLAVSLVAAGCHRAHDSAPASDAGAPKSGALIARVGHVELRESDLERMMARDPGAAPQRFETAAARGELLDGLIRFELLAQAAERAGLMQDPDAIHAQQQIAVTKLVNQTLGAAASPEAVTEADVEHEYLARQATDFTLPPAAHVRHIRVSERAAAARISAQARRLTPTDDAGFAALAEKTTEDATTRATGGDLGFVDKNSRLEPALVHAVLALTQPGEMAGPIETGAGFEIVRLVSSRAAAVSPLSSVAESIRQRLYRERRAKALEDFIAKLRTETPVEIVDAKTTALAGAH